MASTRTDIKPTTDGSHTATAERLSAEELRNLDAYWRACNYLAAGMIYLRANPLLREPLMPEHVKLRLLGHWGSSPGLSFAYLHLNRLITKYDLDVIFLAGPGHGAPGVLAPAYLEGTYSEVYPDKGEDEEGMRTFFKEFSFPGGIGSHCTPETPGSIHEGGELGYSVSHAFGAAFDNPDLLVAVMVGDGEAETGALATSWHANKFLNPIRDGAVLPILHLNGYKINNPTLLARISHDELESLFKGYGWSKRSISRFLHVSRPTITAWIARFEAENLESLEDRSRAPKTTVRKAWLPAMVAIYHLQKRHPDAGGFRIWSLRGKSDLSVRTVERIMAINRRVYTDIPGTAAKHTPQTEPQPHPFKATAAHEYWFIDGRMMDFALEGHRWWSLIILDGYSRTMLAGAVAPSEASWVALTVLYTACLRYGVPQHVISDSGGAFISEVFAGVCTRLGIDHKTIVSTEGQSYMNLMETHFNIQRRLYDYQFSLTQTPLEFEEAHQHFLELYNTTAHQGLLKEQFASPIPLHVLGEAKGRLYTPQELERKFARALFPRTTNRYGCVTLHSYHFYVDQGLPQTQVLLWVYGQELRAVCEHVLLAEYHCHYDLREGKVTDIRVSQFYPSPFASRQEQGALIERNPLESVVIYRPKALRRPAVLPLQAEQLWLFARVQVG